MATRNCKFVFKLVILLLFVTVGSCDSNKGPYSIIPISMTTCKDQGTNEMNISIEEYQGRFALFADKGEFTWPPDADQLKVTSTVFRNGSNWSLLSYSPFFDKLCTAANNSPEIYKIVSNAIGQENICPWPPGHYKIQRAIGGDRPIPPFSKVLQYGNYLSKHNFVNAKNEIIGCVEAIFDVKPASE